MLVKTGLAVAVSLILIETGSATPTNTRTGPPIVNGTNSLVFPDTQDNSILWVSPPNEGKAGEAKLSMETPAAECDSMNNIIESAKLYTKQIRTLATQRNNLLEKMSELNDQNTDEAIKLYSKAEELNVLILKGYQSMNALVAESAKNHGGTLLVSFLHDQGANIEKIKTQNPSYKDVRPIDTYNARMYFAVPGSVQDGLDIALLPIINSYSVAGIKAADLAKSPVQIAQRTDVTISLTKIGACLMAKPQLFGTNTNPKFALTAIYEYPFAFKTSVRASYNLKNIYRFISQTGKRGGVFSSKSFSKITESNWGDSALKFHWSDDDPGSKITAAERFEQEKSVKADLLANLDKLIMAKTGLKPSPAPNPGPHGATVVASGLDKACPGNPYCMAASISLRTLDAVFGSSKMTTSIESSLDVTATYQSDALTTRYVSQGVSYSAD